MSTLDGINLRDCLSREANTVFDPIETKLGADFSWKALAALPSSFPSRGHPRVPSWKVRNIMKETTTAKSVLFITCLQNPEKEPS